MGISTGIRINFFLLCNSDSKGWNLWFQNIIHFNINIKKYWLKSFKTALSEMDKALITPHVLNSHIHVIVLGLVEKIFLNLSLVMFCWFFFDISCIFTEFEEWNTLKNISPGLSYISIHFYTTSIINQHSEVWHGRDKWWGSILLYSIMYRQYIYSISRGERAACSW